MTMQRHTVRPNAADNGTALLGSHGLLLAACALLLVFGGAGTATAQLPAGSPTQVFVDMFDAGGAGGPPINWTEFHWDPYGTPGDWGLQNNANLSSLKGPCPGDSNRWTSGGSFFVRTTNTKQDPALGQSILFPDGTLSGGSIVVADRTNIRVEYDFYLRDDPEGRAGVMWAASDSNGDNVVDDGYLFYVTGIPDDTDSGSKASYELIKRTAGVDLVLQSGLVDLSPAPTWPAGFESIFEDFCYRIRLDYYCGYVRVQFKRFDCDASTCSESDWETAMQWTHDPVWGPEPAAGAVGMFSGSHNASGTVYNFFDNIEISTWGSCGTPTPVPTNTPMPTNTPTPGPECGPWTDWTEENREPLVFKNLYEGGLIDYSAARTAPGRKNLLHRLEAPRRPPGADHHLGPRLGPPLPAGHRDRCRSPLGRRRHIYLVRQLRRGPAQRHLQPGADGGRRCDPDRQFAARCLRLVRRAARAWWPLGIRPPGRLPQVVRGVDHRWGREL
jgi:hypothetical protein